MLRESALVGTGTDRSLANLRAAIRVVDGVVEVISEGQWRHFEAPIA